MQWNARPEKADRRPSMPHEAVTLKLTTRQAQALRALAELEDLPPEVYAAEVLAKHLYHAYTPDVARRAAAPGGDTP
jgi:type III secretory pathway component EscU